VKIVLMATVFGAALGLALGATAAFIHVNVRAPKILGVAITPSIWGFLIGGAVGFCFGLSAAFVRLRIGRIRPSARERFPKEE
jgi:hypothetical protein